MSDFSSSRTLHRMEMCREALIVSALSWEKYYGVAPAITSAVSEYDAARLIGMSDDEYSRSVVGRSAVGKGHDFVHHGLRYQVKANRPSGKKGSFVTLVPKPKNYEWDHLIWILYDKEYSMMEAWLWAVDDFKTSFDDIKRLSPAHYRHGTSIGAQSLMQIRK